MNNLVKNISVLNRHQVFAIHLGASLLLLLVPLGLVMLVWYPEPYFSTDGGRHGLIIVAALFLALGPMLTLIVIYPGKSVGKKIFDLCAIIFIQISLLIAGSYVIFSQRPVVVVFTEGAFRPVVADPIVRQGVPVSEIRKLNGATPPVVYSRLPRDGDELARMTLRALNEGIEIFQQVETFERLDDHLDSIRAQEENVQRLAEGNEKFSLELESFRQARNAGGDDLVYAPFNGRYEKVLFAIDDKGRFVGTLYRAYD